MSSSTDDPELRELQQLLEARNADPSDSELETRFYNHALMYLLKTANHWWCSEAVFPIAKESLWLFSLPDHEHIQQYKARLNAKLSSCALCAQQYHEAKRLLRHKYNTIFPKDSVEKFFGMLQAFDHDRILSELEATKRVPFSLTDSLRSAVCELLFSPHLLRGEMDGLFCRLFDEIQNTGVFPTFESSAGRGVMLLTFHHHRVVGFWARKLLEKYAREGYRADPDSLSTLCSLTHPLIPQQRGTDSCPFKATQETGDLWKAFRLVVNVLDVDSLTTLVSTASTTLPAVLRQQLSSLDNGHFSDVLRVMTDMLIKLGERFWETEDTKDSSPFVDLVKSICEHREFKNTMKIAQDGNVGKILQRDGTPYPEDKLVAKMRVNVDWIYPLWESLRNTPVETDMTGKVLDILLGYFQLGSWATLFKSCCAQLGFKVIQRQLLDSQPPNEKINEYAQRLVDFATMEPTCLPAMFGDLPDMAVAILVDVLARDTRALQDTLLAFSRPTSDSIDISKGSLYEEVWAAVEKIYKQNKIMSPVHVARAVLKAYVPIAGIDVPFIQLDSESMETRLLSRIRDRRLVTKDVLESIINAPSDTQRSLVLDSTILEPFLSFLCSPFPELQTACAQLLQKSLVTREYSDPFRYFFEKEPHRALVTFTTLLGNFNDLGQTIVDVFNLVPTVTTNLRQSVQLLTGDEDAYLLQMVLSDFQSNKTECMQLKTFWDVSWRTMSAIFGQGLKWAENHKPKLVVDLILPVLEIALQLTGSQRLFDKMAQNRQTKESELNYVHMCEAMDYLSHWIYVTRNEVLQRLVPLTLILLRQLQDHRLKVSFEAYDRLMTAATGVNTSRLSDDEKEQLFVALSAHEPDNAIFIDDSDEEDVEWQVINTAQDDLSDASRRAKSLPSMQEESFLGSSSSFAKDKASRREKGSKITSYFSATEPDSQPMEVDDDLDEFGDIDFSELPEEWFEGKPASDSAGHQKTNDMSKGTPQWGTGTIDNHRQVTPKTSGTTSTARLPPSNRTIGPRVFPPKSSQTFAVTSTGRKLKPPPMGFSKLKSLRAEFRAERRLNATVMSPSAASARRHQGGNETTDNSSSCTDSSDEEDGNGNSGLLDLVQDIDDSRAAIEAEKASVKALFEQKPRRSIKLIESPATKYFMQKRQRIQALAERRKKTMPDIDRMYKAIFSWDMTSKAEMPPNASKDQYIQVNNSYDTFQAYIKTFEPLLHLEIWMQLVRAKEALSEADVIERCLLDGRCHVNDFVDLTFHVPSNMTATLATDDLVCVANHFGQHFFDEESSDQKRAWRGRLFLGRITAMTQKKNLSSVTIRSHFSNDQITLLNTLSPKTMWCILRLMSLTTAQREFSALQGLEYYDLAEEILRPKPQPQLSLSEQEIANCIQSYSVNRPQAEAIVGAVTKKKGFTLIQGPPGTGKTKTILGLIAALLKERPARYDVNTKDTPRAAGKLLVCAPSNAAVDEIAKRLKEGIPSGRTFVRPNVVRIGVADAVNTSVKDLILDRLIEKELVPTVEDPATRKKWSMRRDNIKEEMRKIQLDIEDVERELAGNTEPSLLASLRDRRRQLFQDRARHNAMLKSVYDDQRDYTREMEMSRVHARQKIFANADVVCATLSGSGHDMLTNLGLTFETVVVDEAAQAIEISSLIPLKYDCQRCVLVGDPNQLPPTVLSQMASKYNYEQSLFMRLQNSTPEDVYLLSIQYRMHPEISMLPSRLFYQARLQDGPDMATVSSAVWHSQTDFPPYCFFNIQDGREQTGRGKSLYNTAEADAAVALVDKLASRLPMVKFAYKIGVITPYKQQLSQLKSRFERRFGSRILDVIDFNTVDGFQGQEKDIILFSCVRAGSSTGIGFLSDVRRMNVGLTRAKRSLFVLGHAPTLKKSQFWGDLVRNAEERDLLVNCHSPFFDHPLAPSGTTPNLFEKDTSMATKRPLQERVMDMSLEEPKAPAVKRKHEQNLHNVKETRRRLTDGQRATIRGSTRKVAAIPIVTTTGGEDKNNKKEKGNSGGTSERREGDMKRHSLAKQQQAPLQNQPQKMTLAEYRASRGLPPLSSTGTATSTGAPPMVRRTGAQSKGCSLFIPKDKRPLKRPAAPDITADGLGARDRIILEHKAAKESMRRIRQEENEQQQQRLHGETPRPTTTANLDALLKQASRRSNPNDSL